MKDIFCYSIAASRSANVVTHGATPTGFRKKGRVSFELEKVCNCTIYLMYILFSQMHSLWLLGLSYCCQSAC